MKDPAEQGAVAEHTATDRGRAAGQKTQKRCPTRHVNPPRAHVLFAGPRRCCASAPQLQAVENRQNVLKICEIAVASEALAADVFSREQ